MAPTRTPSLRAQLLGKLLREFRENAGFTLLAAGTHIQRDRSNMSRMESGAVPARTPDLHVLLGLYRVTDTKLVAALDQLCRDVSAKGWWDEYASALPDWFLDFPWLEERSRAIKSYDALIPPGLLQTREFAEATIRATDVGSKERSVRGLEYRMARQRVLDSEKPPRLFVLLEQDMLHRPVGGPAVMRAQLEHLAEMGERSTIEVGVVPYKVGAHAGLSGSFQVFELADLLSDAAISDTLAGTVYVEQESVARYRSAYDELHALALSPTESRQLILSVAEDMR